MCGAENILLREKAKRAGGRVFFVSRAKREISNPMTSISVFKP